MDRLIFLKGDVYISKNASSIFTNEPQIVICTETTCSKTSKTFKGVDLKTGDVSEYNTFDYIKSKTDRLYTKNEMNRNIALTKYNLLDKCLTIRMDTTTIKRWRDIAQEEYSNGNKE